MKYVLSQVGINIDSWYVVVQFSLVYCFVGSEPGDRCSSQWIFILTR